MGAVIPVPPPRPFTYIPECSLIYMPLKAIKKNPERFAHMLASYGPLQVATMRKDGTMKGVSTVSLDASLDEDDSE